MKEKEHRDLFSRAVHGGAWTVATRVLVQAVSLVRYVVLARVLDKSDWGLLGVALLMIQTLNTFTNTGFNAALVQKKEDITGYLDTAWTVGLIRAVILCIMMYVAAPLMAMINVPPEKVALTIWVIRAMGLTLVIGALGNVGIVYLRKELEFNKIFRLGVCRTLLDVVVVITVVVVYKTVWALVAGKLAAAVFGAVYSYLLHPYRPSFSLDMAKARQLWKFGKWMFGGTVLGFLITQGDDYFVWCYLGISALGVYQLSYRFSHLPATEITNVISRVTFPAYSKVQDDTGRMRDAYLKVLELSAFLAVPAAGLIWVMADDFVILFLKEKWLPAIPVIQVLALRGMICSIGATRGPLFMAVGKPRLGVRIKSVKLILLIILIYPLTERGGIVGTSWAIVLADLLVQPMAFWISLRLIDCSLMRMLRPVFFAVASTAVMVGAVLMLKLLVFTETTYVRFFVVSLLAGCAFLATAFLFERVCGYRIRYIIQEQIAVMRQKDLR